MFSTSDQPITRRQAMRMGFQRGFPVVLGYLPLGFAFGVLALQNGVPGYAAVLMSVFVFAGSGQFIAVGLWGMGASALSIVLTNVIINLRYMLMCAALAPWLAHFTKLQQALFSVEVTDEVFALHASAMRAGEEPRLPLLFSLNITAHMGWILGTFLGVVSGSMLADPKGLGLDYALPAMFLALLVPQCQERLHVLIAVLAGVLSVVLALAGAGSWNVIVSTVVAATLATWMTRNQEIQVVNS